MCFLRKVVGTVGPRTGSPNRPFCIGEPARRRGTADDAGACRRKVPRPCAIGVPRRRTASSPVHSDGNAASSSIGRPLAGCTKRSRRACRNMRSKRSPDNSVPRASAAIEREVAVLGIASDGVAGIGEMDTDLVRASGLQGHVEQAEAGEPLRHAHQRDRAPAALVVVADDPDMATAVAQQILAQGDIDDLQPLGPGAGDERRIGLADRPLRQSRAQVVLQRHQRRPGLGEEQQPRGLLVEPMDQLEKHARARPAQLLDHAEAFAAAAVDGDARGLVDAEQRLVFVDDRELASRCFRPLARDRRPAPAGSAPRRRAPGACRRRRGRC